MESVQKIKTWRNGADGFFQWLTDVKPRVPSSKGGYEVYVPGKREAAEIRLSLSGDYRTIVYCWPRRHGKTLASALIIVWRFLTRQTQTIGIVANSQKQTPVDVLRAENPDGYPTRESALQELLRRKDEAESVTAIL